MRRERGSCRRAAAQARQKREAAASRRLHCLPPGILPVNVVTFFAALCCVIARADSTRSAAKVPDIRQQRYCYTDARERRSAAECSRPQAAGRASRHVRSLHSGGAQRCRLSSSEEKTPRGRGLPRPAIAAVRDTPFPPSSPSRRPT